MLGLRESSAYPDPAKSVAVNATFLQLVPGRPLFMAGVPLSSVLHKTAFMPYLSGAGFTPTLALVSLQSQDVTLIARTGFDGAELCRATMNFGAGHHRSFLLRDVLSCTSTSEGTLEIRGDPLLPGSMTGIGFEAHDEGAFVTQPIWTSLARVTGEMFAPADEAAFNDLSVGKRVATNYPTVYVDFVSPGRFRETEGADTYTGSYTYRNTGSNTGTVTFNYDDGDRCTASLTFDSTTSGTATSTCDDGLSVEYDWRLIDIPTGGDDTAETRYNVGDVITTLPNPLPSIFPGGQLLPTVGGLGASFSRQGMNWVFSSGRGGYFEVGDYRYTCDYFLCGVENGVVTFGTIVETSIWNNN